MLDYSPQQVALGNIEAEQTSASTHDCDEPVDRGEVAPHDAGHDGLLGEQELVQLFSDYLVRVAQARLSPLFADSVNVALEAMANAPANRDRLAAGAEAATDVDEAQSDWIDSIFPPQTVEAPLIKNLGQVFEPTVTQRRPRLRIPVPKGQKRPDDFFGRVAAAYSYLAGHTRRPATELAARNDVPVTTVHGWIKEARRRGLLGPGRRGSAG